MSSDEDDIKPSKYITDRILVTIFQWETFPFHSSIDLNDFKLLGELHREPRGNLECANDQLSLYFSRV